MNRDTINSLHTTPVTIYNDMRNGGWRAHAGYRRKVNVKFEVIKSTVFATQAAAEAEGLFMRVVLDVFGVREWKKCYRPVADAGRRVGIMTDTQYLECAARFVGASTMSHDLITANNIRDLSDKELGMRLRVDYGWQTLRADSSTTLSRRNAYRSARVVARKLMWFPLKDKGTSCFSGLEAVRYHVLENSYEIGKPINKERHRRNLVMRPLVILSVPKEPVEFSDEEINAVRSSLLNDVCHS